MTFGYTVAGFFVGAVVGLTGVGGGSLMTPLLVLLAGIHPVTAVGTDLLYAAITKAGGTLVHGKHKNVDWGMAARLASGSLPAAVLTLWLLHTFRPGGVGGATKLISGALGVALVLTALSLLFRRRIQQYAAARSPQKENPRRIALLTVLVGAVLGILVSISSVGAGALGVTALIFLYPRMSTLKIIGTDIVHAMALTLVAGVGHLWLGSIDWTLLSSLLIGSLPGIMLGSHLAVRVPERVLRPLLASLLMIVGGRLILR